MDWTPPPDGNIRDLLRYEFPIQFGGFHQNRDGTNTVLWVGDRTGIEGWLRARGFLATTVLRETDVALAGLERCKLMLEADPVLAPGVVIEAVGIRDSESALTAIVIGDLETARRELRARLGQDQAVNLLQGPTIEQDGLSSG